LYTLKTPMTMKLGCVGSKSKINFGTEANVDFAGKRSKTYFDVANIDKYNVILGLPYMNKNNIILDIPRQIIKCGNVEVKALQRGDTNPEPQRRNVPQHMRYQQD